MPDRSPTVPGSAPEAAPLPAGTIFGKYRVLRFVASGAMGVVYEAEHTALKTRHALKIIHPQLARDERFLKRFRHEARLMANLEHPNITRVTDFGEEAGRCYFVMEFVAGPKGRPQTLQDLLEDPERKEPMSDREIRELFLQICSALSYCHHFRANGVVHRDLKPSNILLRPAGSPLPRVAITDFGLAEMAGGLDSFSTLMPGAQAPQATPAGLAEISGTPRYMSPEQWQPGAGVGPASDIFTVGVLLYQALTRRLPFRDSRVLLDPKTARIEKPSQLKRAHHWDPIVMRCLALKPEDRYRDADDLARDLARIGQIPGRTVAVGSAALLLVAFVLFAHVRAPPEAPTIPDTAPPPVDEPVSPAPEAPPKSEPILLEVQVRVPPQYGQPFALPRTGEIQINDEPWRPVNLPLAESVAFTPELRVALRVPGYEPTAPRVIRAGAGSRAPVTLDLVPMPARVTITCNEPTARILAGDKDLGPVGQTIELTAFQEHRLLIRSPRHREQVLVINRPDPAQAVPPVYHVELEPIPGRLRIEATRPDVFHPRKVASIFLDGRSWAEEKLPFVINGLTQEFVTVGIEMPGYKPIEPRRIRVIPGEEAVVKFDLAFLDAFLRFNVEPSNAVIMLSGTLVTSNRVRVIPDQFYTIRLDAPGHLPMTMTVAVTANEERVISANLEPRSYLLLDLDPTNAVVFVGGRRITSRQVEVTGGRNYLLDVRAPNYQPATTNVWVGAGESRVVTLKLRKRSFIP